MRDIDVYSVECHDKLSTKRKVKCRENLFEKENRQLMEEVYCIRISVDRMDLNFEIDFQWFNYINFVLLL